MSDDRTEWPTAGKLEELREEGAVPWDFLSIHACRSFLILLILAFSSGSVRKVFQVWKDPSLESWSTTWGAVYLSFFKEIATVTLAIVIVSLMLSLLQTRFLIRFRFLSPRFFRRSGSRSFLGTGAELFAVVLCALLPWVFPKHPLSLLHRDQVNLTVWLQEFAKGSALFFLLLLIGIAIVSFGLSRIMFLSRYRMTRQEKRAAESGE
jgi:flagellar biosynthesis protein FlhB